MSEVSKADWKLFREKIGDWQEQYMARLNEAYIALLQEDKPASEKFWELDKQLKNDKKSPGVIIEMRKSNLYYDIADLIRDGVITMEDLDDFSDELKASVKYML